MMTWLSSLDKLLLNWECISLYTLFFPLFKKNLWSWWWKKNCNLDVLHKNDFSCLAWFCVKFLSFCCVHRLLHYYTDHSIYTLLTLPCLQFPSPSYSHFMFVIGICLTMTQAGKRYNRWMMTRMKWRIEK